MNNKYLLITAAVFVTVVLCSTGNAQPYGRGRQMGKIEQLEKLKLLEILDMNEETSTKFFVRRKDFKERQRNQVERMDSLVEEIQDAVHEKKESTQLKKMNDEYLRAFGALQKIRADYFNSLSDLLSPEQIAKLIMFEKRFREELQDMMFKNRGGRNRMPPPED